MNLPATASSLDSSHSISLYFPPTTSFFMSPHLDIKMTSNLFEFTNLYLHSFVLTPSTFSYHSCSQPACPQSPTSAHLTVLYAACLLPWPLSHCQVTRTPTLKVLPAITKPTSSMLLNLSKRPKPSVNHLPTKAEKSSAHLHRRLTPSDGSLPLSFFSFGTRIQTPLIMCLIPHPLEV